MSKWWSEYTNSAEVDAAEAELKSISPDLTIGCCLLSYKSTVCAVECSFPEKGNKPIKAALEKLGYEKVQRRIAGDAYDGFAYRITMRKSL